MLAKTFIIFVVGTDFLSVVWAVTTLFMYMLGFTFKGVAKCEATDPKVKDTTSGSGILLNINTSETNGSHNTLSQMLICGL